jgi:hypothetical protein
MVEFLRVAWMPVNRMLAKLAGILIVVTALGMPGLVAADIIIPLQDHGDMTVSMERVLVERGWNVTTAEDGSILLYPKNPDAASVNTFASENELQQRVINSVENPVIDVAFWQANLEPHGWNVEQEPDGSVLLIPGAKERMTERPISSVSPEKKIPAVIDLAALRHSLIQHGWSVDYDHDGSLLLSLGTTDIRYIATTPLVSPGPGILNWAYSAYWQDRLESHGWVIEHTADGSLVLTPGFVEQQTEAALTSISPALEAQKNRASTLRDFLSQHGWRVEHDLERDLFLIPGVMDHHSLAAVHSQLFDQHPHWL